MILLPNQHLLCLMPTYGNVNTRDHQVTRRLERNRPGIQSNDEIAERFHRPDKFVEVSDRSRPIYCSFDRTLPTPRFYLPPPGYPTSTIGCLCGVGKYWASKGPLLGIP